MIIKANMKVLLNLGERRRNYSSQSPAENTEASHPENLGNPKRTTPGWLNTCLPTLHLPTLFPSQLCLTHWQSDHFSQLQRKDDELSPEMLEKILLKITHQVMKPNSKNGEPAEGFWDLCPTGEPLLFSWSHVSRESLTRNGQLLDLKLQVNCGVLIWFGSSSLKTHGPLQTW